MKIKNKKYPVLFSLSPSPYPMLICVYEYKKVQKKNPRLVILPFFISNPSKRDGSWKIEKRFYTRQNVTDFYSFKNRCRNFDS